jgi:hypothetical protein
MSKEILQKVIKDPQTFWYMQTGEEGPFFISFKYTNKHCTEEGKDFSDEAEIILLTDKGFIIQGEYHMPVEWRVTEYDLNGNAIYRVPFDACDAIYNPEEYNCLCQMRDADERLMSYM